MNPLSWFSFKRHAGSSQLSAPDIVGAGSPPPAPLASISLPPSVPFSYRLRSIDEYRAFREVHHADLTAQRAFESTLFSGRPEFSVRGYCSGCDAVTDLRVDLNWGNGSYPNWRERLECGCGLNNRVRASVLFLKQHCGLKRDTRIYATEQVTALFRLVAQLFPNTTGSEFLRDGTPSGSLNQAGIRHEDLTSLSFADGSFDVILSFDVLEHVPDYAAALREMSRILVPGGTLIASFPFDIQAAETEIRATIDSEGTITHLLPPEYHGDPISLEGCLCFQRFGWSVLDDLEHAGFSDASVLLYWSADHGYLGPDQLLIIATR
jgi:SAM-dependent methyltransferase